MRMPNLVNEVYFMIFDIILFCALPTMIYSEK